MAHYMALSDITTVFSAKSDSQLSRLSNWHSYHCANNGRSAIEPVYPLHNLYMGFKETTYATLYMATTYRVAVRTRIIQGSYKGHTDILSAGYSFCIPEERIWDESIMPAKHRQAPKKV